MKTAMRRVVAGTTISVAMVLFFVKMTATAQQDAVNSFQTRAAPPDEPVHEPGVPVSATPPPAPFVRASDIVRHGHPEKLFLRSSVVLIMDEREGVVLHRRNIDEPRPIASLTKLMTALVLLDASLPLDETIEITRADRDRLRGSKSRLSYGMVLTRYDLLHVALAASDNRAAAALARTYVGGRDAMIAAMNNKARELGMTHTHFAGPAGLHSGNVSTARDLLKLVSAIDDYPLIKALSTSPRLRVIERRTSTQLVFHNTNRLVRKHYWNIALSKTGYIADAGNCLLMQTTIAERPLVIILLNSWGKLSKFGDSNRIRRWLLNTERKIQALAESGANT